MKEDRTKGKGETDRGGNGNTETEGQRITETWGWRRDKQSPQIQRETRGGIWGGLGCPERKRERMAFSWWRVVCKTPLPRSYAGS